LDSINQMPIDCCCYDARDARRFCYLDEKPSYMATVRISPCWQALLAFVPAMSVTTDALEKQCRLTAQAKISLKMRTTRLYDGSNLKLPWDWTFRSGDKCAQAQALLAQQHSIEDPGLPGPTVGMRALRAVKF